MSEKEPKKIKDPEEVVSSLINLRDELFAKKNASSEMREVFFKINSCLYSKYPLEDK